MDPFGIHVILRPPGVDSIISKVFTRYVHIVHFALCTIFAFTCIKGKEVYGVLEVKEVFLQSVRFPPYPRIIQHNSVIT